MSDVIRRQSFSPRLPENKFSVRSSTSQIDTVILADQVLEIRMRNGQIHALRRVRVEDPIDRPNGWFDEGVVADEL